jgi:hypothetical protein
MRVLIAGQRGVLPIDVHAVEGVPAHEPNGAVDESPPAVLRQGRVGETLRPRPAADRDQDLEVRMRSPELGQGAQVVGVLRCTFHDHAIYDVREGVVDMRQLLRVDITRGEGPAIRKYVSDNHTVADDRDRRWRLG